MKLWPWTKDREVSMDGPPIPTQVLMPDGTTVEGQWVVADDFKFNGKFEAV